MDANRFDSIARVVTAAGSRRGALAALLGGTLVPLLGPLDAASKKRKGKKGKKKKKKGQGQCAAPTQGCSSTSECCGELVCGSDDACCAPIPTPCASHEECCLGLCQTDGEGRPRCCVPDGSPCGALDRLCCSLNCLPNGTCAATDPGPTCLGPGGVCEDTDECCGELICFGAINECCAPLGGVCLSNDECCLGECQTDNDGEPRCCSLEGAICNLGRECCSGNCRPNNTCAPTGPNCLANGETCQSSGECCSAFCDEGGEEECCVPMDGACVDAGDCCAYPNVTGIACELSNGANRCCAQAGSACGPSAGPTPDIACCPGLDCVGGGFIFLCQ